MPESKLISKDVAIFYELSLEADNDLDEIYNYTVERFGDDQAVAYLTALEYTFDSLCQNPEIGRERNEVREDLRSISQDSHVIFYRILVDRIRIIRVLHYSRDIGSFL